MNLKKGANDVLTLSVRNIKIFLRDKAGVFFSFLSAIIVLLLYVLFLQKLQKDSLINALNNIPNLTYDVKNVDYFLNSWLLSGVIGLSSFTIPLGALSIMVMDKVKKIENDFLVSPVSGISLYFSYFLSSFIITIIMNLLVFLIGEILILSMGGKLLSFVPFLQFFGTLIFSSIVNCLMLVLIVSFIKSEAVFSSVSAITSATLGFVIGAYMPINMYPKFLQGFCNLIPGSHSSALFRNIFMDAPLNALVSNQEIVDAFKKDFSFELMFFGKTIGQGVMYLYLGIMLALFVGINILVFGLKRKKLKKD